MLGIVRGEKQADLEFLSQFYAWLTESQAPWPQVFFDWFGGPASESRAKDSPAATHYNTAMFAPIKEALMSYAPVRPGFPYFQSPTPTSLLIDEIEAIWAPIAEDDDWSAFEAKLADIEALRQVLA